MIPALCLNCNTEQRPSVYDPLCKNCRAEIALTHGSEGVKAFDTLLKSEKNMTVTVDNPNTGVMAKAVKCESCGKPEVYDPTKRKNAYFCDECGKQLCTACAAYCNHKDWNYVAKILCKNCRAEKSLTGQPVDEVEGSLPGQETVEKPREPKPHCGRATCVGEFCGCECKKCKEAVASGFMEPMFGKMTPDPDPEPEPAEDDSDEEEEIARAEGSQP